MNQFWAPASAGATAFLAIHKIIQVDSMSMDSVGESYILSPAAHL